MKKIILRCILNWLFRRLRIEVYALEGKRIISINAFHLKQMERLQGNYLETNTVTMNIDQNITIYLWFHWRFKR